MKTPYLICADCETTGLSAEQHEVVQLAAVAYDGQTMEPVPEEDGGVFNSLLKPLKPETIQDQALKVNGLTREVLAEAPHPRPVWQAFEKYVRGFNPGKGPTTAPILCGKNIRNFDMHFFAEMKRKYSDKGEKAVLFNAREQIDLEDLLRQWFWHDPSVEKMSMDYVRERFSMLKDRAHSALGDVIQTGYMITYFLKLTRELADMRDVDGRKLIDFEAAFKGR